MNVCVTNSPYFMYFRSFFFFLLSFFFNLFFPFFLIKNKTKEKKVYFVTTSSFLLLKSTNMTRKIAITIFPIFLIVAIAIAHIPSDVEQNIVFVAPEKEVRGVPISAREPTLVGIAPEKLDPHSIYEVTLSYPATTPSVYTVKFVSDNDDTEYYRRTSTTRTLQNVHQFHFSIDGDNPPIIKLSSGTEILLLSISVAPEGKSPLGVKNDPDEFSVSTNIFLSRHAAGIPVRAAPVLLFAAGIGVFVVFCGLFVLPKTKFYASFFESKTVKKQEHEL